MASSIYITCSSSVSGLMEDVGEAAADIEEPLGGIGWTLDPYFVVCFVYFNREQYLP